jgi:acylphosphatase
MPSEVYHKDVWFSGRVQGVGFRLQTMYIARGYDVTGQVQNMNDGRVFLQAEGTEKEVSAFLDEIKRQMKSYIRDTEERSFSGAPCFKDFRIVH